MGNSELIARVTVDGATVTVTEKRVTVANVWSDTGLLIETDLQVALVGCKTNGAAIHSLRGKMRMALPNLLDKERA